jgi:hypothetical protein
LVKNIEDILTIEKLWIPSYLLKLKEKPEVSMGYEFGATRFQVPPSAPPTEL